MWTYSCLKILICLLNLSPKNAEPLRITSKSKFSNQNVQFGYLHHPALSNSLLYVNENKRHNFWKDTKNKTSMNNLLCCNKSFFAGHLPDNTVWYYFECPSNLVQRGSPMTEQHMGSGDLGDKRHMRLENHGLALKHHQFKGRT